MESLSPFCRTLSFLSWVEDWRDTPKVPPIGCSRFLWACLTSPNRKPVSSPRLIKPIVPISSNGLTCSLRVKGYETAPAGEAFGSGPSR